MAVGRYRALTAVTLSFTQFLISSTHRRRFPYHLFACRRIHAFLKVGTRRGVHGVWRRGSSPHCGGVWRKAVPPLRRKFLMFVDGNGAFWCILRIVDDLERSNCDTTRTKTNNRKCAFIRKRCLMFTFC